MYIAVLYKRMLAFDLRAALAPIGIGGESVFGMLSQRLEYHPIVCFVNTNGIFVIKYGMRSAFVYVCAVANKALL